MASLSQYSPATAEPPKPAEITWQAWFRTHIDPAYAYGVINLATGDASNSFCTCCGAVITDKAWLASGYRHSAFGRALYGITFAKEMSSEEFKKLYAAQGGKVDYPDLHTFDIVLDGTPHCFIWRDTDGQS
jgi:hypothetical protein